MQRVIPAEKRMPNERKQNLKASGKTFQANGHAVHMGEFTLRSFDGDILEVGCHRIEWAEIMRVAPALRAVANIYNVA